MARSIVSIVYCGDYKPDKVRAAVSEALQLAGLQAAFAAGRSVLIKPNLLSTRQPEDAVTTHPSVVAALAQIALEHGCTPAIGDSPPFAGENSARWQRLAQATGMSQVAADLGIEMKRFEDARVQHWNPDGRIYKGFEIAEAVAQADVVVNVAKLKTHGLTLLTGAVKNVFGCIPGIQKGLFHVKAAEDRETFAQMLVDACFGIKPAVHVMDAVVALEGDGPNHGRPKAVGLIMASSDPVALDAVASAVVGVDPFAVHTTRLAHEQGLGCGNLGEIKVRGAAIEQVRIPDFRLSSGANEWTKIPHPIRRFLRRQLVASPQMDPRECVGCGDCVSACPVHAITTGKPPVVNYETCIRCYCCNEVCNYGAVRLRPGLLGRLISALSQKR